MMAIDKKAVEEAGHAKLKQHKETSPKEHKAHLKTLVKNSNVSRARNAGRIVKYGTASFWRNAWLSVAATLVMTVTLVILMVTVVASLILTATADTMREKIDITIFFKPGTSQEALDEMAETMKADPNIKTVEVVNSEQEYQNFLAENAGDESLAAALEDEAMQELMLDTMQSTMRVKVNDSENLDSVKAIVDTNEIFQANLDEEKAPTYDVNRSEIETINSWAAIAKNGGLILGAVFLVISILVIFNTIRMAIFSRREEIYMMQLVGADKSFIRGPFIVEAQICGAISGVLASTIAFFAFRAIAPGLTEYGIDVSMVTAVIESSYLVLVYAAMILVGIIVGTISARLAVAKYLK